MAEYNSFVEILQQRASELPEFEGYRFLRDGESEFESLTYSQLNERAEAVAGFLEESGASGERVILLYPPGLDFLVGFFGCLYGRAIAVPAYPPRSKRGLPRLLGIVRDSRPAVILTCSALLRKIRALLAAVPELESARLVATDELSPALARSWKKELPDRETTAFLQYTSGSTSSPKGVMVDHANLLANEKIIQQAFGQSRESVILSWLPIYHDMGLIGGMLQPLYLGARCVFMSPMTFLQRPARWLEAISKHQATTSGGPNFAYDLCVRKIGQGAKRQLDLSTWSVAFNGSEPVRSSTLERFAEAFAPCGFRREAFYPCYGLAEATLFVTGGSVTAAPAVVSVDADALRKGHWVDKRESGSEHSMQHVSCGIPATDHRVAIVDPETRLRLPGRCVGEIWIAGPSVARGYWNQPAATEHSFQARIEDEPTAGPFLRTGDLGVSEYGELFVTGRLKDLIIIRGRNYYPQDLELSAERSHPSLRPGCGAAFSVEVGESERLVIVYEVERHVSDEREAIVQAVRAAVAEEHELLVYEVVLLQPATIPRTSSGKIQRHACRVQYLGENLIICYRSSAETAAPDGAEIEMIPSRERLRSLSAAERRQRLESWLRQRFSHLVGVPVSSVGPETSLTSLGLDSVVALELAHEVESCLGVLLPFPLLLQGASLSELVSKTLDQLDVEPPPGTPAESGASVDSYAASFGQRGLWFLHRLAPDAAAYVIAGAARIRGRLDDEALKRCFGVLMERHLALRTTFSQSGDGELQARLHEAMECEFVVEAASGAGPESLSRQLAEEAHRPFDLEKGPLFRVRLYRVAPAEHILLLVMHHIVVDFWSLAVLVGELGLLYRSETGGPPAVLEPLSISYADYASWQRRAMAGPEGERLLRYWRARLPGPPAEMPTDRPRPKVQTFSGASRTVRLGHDLTFALGAASAACDTTQYATVLTAFFALLHRYTGQRDLVVGSPTAGRSSAELAGLVGYFTNPVVIRADLSCDPPFETCLRKVYKTALDSFEHQDIPFALLVERLLPKHDPSRSPLFQIQFVWQQDRPRQSPGLAAFSLGEAGISIELGGLALESVRVVQRSAQFDLSLILADLGGNLAASLQYKTDLFEPTTVQRLLRHFASLLAGAVRTPALRLSELPMLSRAERQQSLVEWNVPAHDDDVSTVHRLFEAQAARVPDRVAVVDRDRRMSYGDLDRASDRLARRLRVLGVMPEVPVGICLKRSADMIVGMLGVLKAGGFYVPLDITYPRKRLLFTMEDSQVRVLLVDRQTPADLAHGGMTVVEIESEADGAIGKERGTTKPVTAVDAENLAYLIYTSGSTGRPKGVAIEHRNAVSLLRWAREVFEPRELSRTLASTSICFDLSVFELFLPLAVGGTVILVTNIIESQDLAMSSEVTLINTVPSAMAELVARGASGLPQSVRTINLAGEALSRRLVEQIYEQSLAERVFNLYGPSEDTTYSTFAEVARGEAAPPPIGRPLAGSQVFLADRHLQPVPVGVPAEILLGGSGLARGYFGRPGSTAQRFVPHPFSPQRGARLYRTGDLGRFRADGLLDFLGRIDHQVKIRGYRIELGEIEQFLLRHPVVREAVVLAHESAAGDRQILAYTVLKGQPSPSVRDLCEFLGDHLPSFMVPTRFVFLESLPRTPNGKVDRRALPAPQPDRPEQEVRFVAPRTPVEEMVARIWGELLGTERVGVHDSFFDLGGHSLLATRAVSRLREAFGIELPVSDLFESPTVARVADSIEASRWKMEAVDAAQLPAPGTREDLEEFEL